MKSLSPWLWLLLYGAIIWLSLVPHLIKTPNQSDKMLHITAYCLLMTGPVVLFRSLKIEILAFVALFTTGIAMEIGQHIVGGRESSMEDALANGAGIILGLVIGRLLRSGLDAVPRERVEQS
jgi:VanZ family protein